MFTLNVEFILKITGTERLFLHKTHELKAYF
jgi:hypothetical protein